MKSSVSEMVCMVAGVWCRGWRDLVQKYAIKVKGAEGAQWRKHTVGEAGEQGVVSEGEVLQARQIEERQGLYDTQSVALEAQGAQSAGGRAVHVGEGGSAYSVGTK